MSSHRPDLKPITREGVPAALAKAQQYRVLNDSFAAESICLDILAVDPANAEALKTHVLAITDQFPDGRESDRRRAREAVAALGDAYKVAYYSGVVCERWARGLLHRQQPHAQAMASEWLDRAMDHYAKAEKLRPPGNDESLLRWNACVRILRADPEIKPLEAEAWTPDLE